VDACQDRESRKRSRRQNHKNEQKNVLMTWFIKHECDPYPNNDEKSALAQAAGLEVRQVEQCESAARSLPVNTPTARLPLAILAAAMRLTVRLPRSPDSDCCPCLCRVHKSQEALLARPGQPAKGGAPPD
jgi:hypothetical protein